MKLLKKITFLLFVSLIISRSIAQQAKKESFENNYQAIHWDIENGLSEATMNFFLKDANGFLWISSGYGLNRFDGSTFKNYFAGKNSKTITDNYTLRLIEDSLHNIWIGTTKGLCRYDIKADTFAHFSTPPVNSDSSIHPFYATRDSMYCIESFSLITAYNIHSLSKRILTKLAPSEYMGYNMAILYTIFDTGSNSVWMLEGDVGKPGGGLLQISLSDGKRNHYTWNCYRNIPGHGHVSEGMCYDRKRNCIWINSPDGLIQFTLNDKKFHNIDALNEFVKLKNYDRGTVGIDVDTHGRIWFATYPRGIIIYDPSNQSVAFPFAKDSILQNEVSDANICIYCDRDGITWSGFWLKKGIYQLSPFTPSVQRYLAVPGNPDSLSNCEVINCINGDKGRMWMGTKDGLNIFDPQTGKFEVLRSKDLHIKKSDAIIPLGVNTLTKKAWLFSGVVYEMDLLTRKCNPLIYKDSAGYTLKELEAPYAVPYKNGCIVQGKYNSKIGIFILDADSIVAHQILAFPEDEVAMFNVVTDDHFLFLLGQKTNTTITCSSRNGKWTRISTPLDFVKRAKIFYNPKDQTYWLTNDRQLLQYNQNFHALNKYQVNENIPVEEIISMVPDNRGNIWFNTDRAILRLHPQTGKIIMLTEKDGFKKQNFNSCITPAAKDIYGDLYFPCGVIFGNGFDRVNPDKFRENYPPSSVYLQSLEINPDFFALATGVNNLQILRLKYFQNNITIETGNIDYYSKGKSRIRYKLEEVNKDWQYAPAYYTIRYDGLPPGTYKLSMQAGNVAAQFNGPVKSLLIVISPAFWNTWWFRTIAAICSIALIYGLIRWRLDEKFRIRLEHSEKEKQLAELQQQKTEIEMQALRAQMNPHFIFNSLNSINRFILQNNKAQASEYLTKFSKLVRMILQNSQASLITLESELESLELYLNLEALRFDYHFDYKISVEDDLDISVLKVPPLIIQPYVENAIWHGLMHKEEKGQLDIEVLQEEDYLYVKVIDNGIGRRKAEALASKSATKHKSMGLQITAHRIAMMQNSNGKESPVTIGDLVEPDGSAAGTEVIIKMPVIYD